MTRSSRRSKTKEKKIETTLADLNQDGHNTKQDFRAYAAKVQQNTEQIKQELRLFADGSPESDR